MKQCRNSVGNSESFSLASVGSLEIVRTELTVQPGVCDVSLFVTFLCDVTEKAAPTSPTREEMM